MSITEDENDFARLKRTGLRRRHAGELRVRVAQARDTEAGQEVHVAVAIHVDHVRARRALPEDQGLRETGHLGALYPRESLGQSPRARPRNLGSNLG